MRFGLLALTLHLLVTESLSRDQVEWRGPGVPRLGRSWFAEHEPPARVAPRRVQFPSHAVTMENTAQQSLQMKPTVSPPPLEVEPLIITGPDTNRVDLVFFSDGYVEEEKAKFIEDAMRLATDISGNHTFNTVKPLLNFWAAFSASNESGVGVGGVPKDTPFGLYRDGTELRGVYYSKPEVAGAACTSLGQRCDYPILLGNDPLYGGLGGRFTVITSSLANGAQILRHELGHSIIIVGEEYDGGFGYFGVNAFHNLSEGVPWKQWLTSPPASPDSPIRVERSVMPLQDYAWTLLNASSPWSARFISSGSFSRHLVRTSISGVPSKTDLRVELDGVDLEWVPRENIGVDRWFYDFYVDAPLEGGDHEITFSLMNSEREGDAQLCSVEILEFGDDEEFQKEPGYYGVFPTYSDKNLTSYRPTNEDCLMRQVTTPNFCKVCIEGLWYALLPHVKLIEAVAETCSPEKEKVLDLTLVPLAQFRDTPVDVEESYMVRWTKQGEVVKEWENKTSVVVRGSAIGEYVIDVKYFTEEIRVDEGLTSDGVLYDVTTEC